MGRADDRVPVTLDDDLERQFARMGVQIEAQAAADGTDALEIMGQNAVSLRVWLAVETQWRVAASLGGMIWLGLDYNAVDVVLRRSGLDPGTADNVFADLMIMESSALAAFMEKDP